MRPRSKKIGLVALVLVAVYPLASSGEPVEKRNKIELQYGATGKASGWGLGYTRYASDDSAPGKFEVSSRALHKKAADGEAEEKSSTVKLDLYKFRESNPGNWVSVWDFRNIFRRNGRVSEWGINPIMFQGIGKVYRDGSGHKVIGLKLGEVTDLTAVNTTTGEKGVKSTMVSLQADWEKRFRSGTSVHLNAQGGVAFPKVDGDSTSAAYIVEGLLNYPITRSVNLAVGAEVSDVLQKDDSVVKRNGSPTFGSNVAIGGKW